MNGLRGTVCGQLLKAESFEEWAHGPLHQLSRQIVDWSRKYGATVLRLSMKHTAQLPWADLEALIEYKAEELGIRVIKVAMN
jgi:hypothetical protein